MNRSKIRTICALVAGWSFSALALLCFASCRSPVAVAPAHLASAAGVPDAAGLSRELFDRVNDLRRSEGRKALQWNDQMARSAQAHAGAMANAGRLSHDGFQRRVSDLRSCEVVARATENVARGSVAGASEDPAGMTVSYWRQSPVHRRNLLDSEDTMTGVGCALTDDGQFYFVQLHGRL